MLLIYIDYYVIVKPIAEQDLSWKKCFTYFRQRSTSKSYYSGKKSVDRKHKVCVLDVNWY